MFSPGDGLHSYFTGVGVEAQRGRVPVQPQLIAPRVASLGLSEPQLSSPPAGGANNNGSKGSNPNIGVDLPGAALSIKGRPCM